MTKTESHIDSTLAALINPRKANILPLGLQTILLFGRPGSGKTGIGAGFPNHLYLDLENSATAHDIDEITLPTWEAFVSFVTDVDAGVINLGDKQTLIIDTVNDLWKLCRQSAFRKLKIEDASAGEFGSGFIVPRQMFKDAVDTLLGLSKKGILGTVFIAHEIEEVTTAGNVKVTIARPEIDDKVLPNFIAAKPQMVLRTFISDVNPTTQVPFTEADADGIQRAKAKWLIQATPENASASVKDRTKRLPAYLAASYDSLNKQYTKKGNK